MKDRDLYWLVGLLEGEGSFMKPMPSSTAYPRISIEMTDRDVMQRVSELLDTPVSTVRNRNPSKWKDSFRVTVRGKRARDWMNVLQPLMGERRRAQIDGALAAANPKGRYIKYPDSVVAEVRRRKSYGDAPRSISEDLDIPITTIYSWLSGALRHETER